MYLCGDYNANAQCIHFEILSTQNSIVSLHTHFHRLKTMAMRSEDVASSTLASMSSI